MIKKYSIFLALCTAMSVLSNAGWTNAEGPPTDPARILFEEGVALLNEGKFEKACPKFEQSLAIVEKATTWFAWADCNDKWDRPANALKAYEAYLIGCEKLPEDKKTAHAERLKQAHKRIEALRPLVASITVVVSNGKSFDVFIDDKRRGTSNSIFEFSPLDAGDHHIVVLIPGQPAHDAKITLRKGENRRIELSGSLTAQSGPITTVVQQPQKPAGNDIEPKTSNRGSRIAGFAVIGVGAAGLATSGVATLLMRPHLEVIEQDCTSTSENSATCNTQSGINAANAAKRHANISTIGLGAGAVGVIVGTTLLLVGNRKTDPSRHEQPSITGHLDVTPNNLTLFVTGTW
jgi:hypothetical protein